MIKKISKAIQTAELAIFFAMVPYGEYIQLEIMAENRPYTWAAGHITDIGYAGGLTTVAMLSSKDEHKLKMALAIPTVMGALEALVALHPRINFDWQDVACYYGVALLSYGVDRICNKFHRDKS